MFVISLAETRIILQRKEHADISVLLLLLPKVQLYIDACSFIYQEPIVAGNLGRGCILMGPLRGRAGAGAAITPKEP